MRPEPDRHVRPRQLLDVHLAAACEQRGGAIDVHRGASGHLDAAARLRRLDRRVHRHEGHVLARAIGHASQRHRGANCLALA
eukprot:scaffold54162_cov63-Phaeocystis_antarctica.AAC.1